jgi:hypothetical protein
MHQLASALFLSFALLGAGCSAADPITNKFTCHDVCQRYADCFNSSYDVTGCADKCESDASDSSDKQNKLDDCHDCIGDKSCVSDIANCSSSCGTFVP